MEINSKAIKLNPKLNLKILEEKISSVQRRPLESTQLKSVSFFAIGSVVSFVT